MLAVFTHLLNETRATSSSTSPVREIERTPKQTQPAATSATSSSDRVDSDLNVNGCIQASVSSRFEIAVLIKVSRHCADGKVGIETNGSAVLVTSCKMLSRRAMESSSLPNMDKAKVRSGGEAALTWCSSSWI